MRVAIIRKQYTPFGGAERFIERLAHQFDNTDVKITILAEKWKSKKVKPLDWIPIQARGLFRVTRDWRFRNNVSKILAKADFDIVQTHERLLGADIFRVGDGLHIAWLDRYKRSLGPLKRILIEHDPFHCALLAIERKIALESETTFVANSTLIASELSNYYGLEKNRVVVIPNGVDTSFFSVPTRELRLALRRQFRFSERDWIICFVGSGFFRKGLADLLYAIERLPNRVKLLVAGTDKNSAKYQRLIHELDIAERVRLLGPLNDVRQIYSVSDLFVLPTLYDPSSNAAIEAMSCGLPIISTEDMGSMQEIVMANAGVVSKRDSLSLCKTIDDTLSSPYLSSMSGNARKFATTIDHVLIVPHWLKLYRNFLDR